MLLPLPVFPAIARLAPNPIPATPMSYYPICLDITDRHCIVIGGGRVAARKAQGLLAHGARVTVISPQLDGELAPLAEAGRLAWRARPYRKGDLADAFLVIAATDDPAVQERIHAEAEAGNILLNVADVPKWCNFILPAAVRRGDFSLAVSTGGKSPALAKQLREELETQFGEEYATLLVVLGALRPLVLAQGRPHSDNKLVFARLLHPDMPSWLRANRWDKLIGHFRSVLGDEVSLDCLTAIQAQCTPPSAGSVPHE